MATVLAYIRVVGFVAGQKNIDSDRAINSRDIFHAKSKFSPMPPGIAYIVMNETINPERHSAVVDTISNVGKLWGKVYDRDIVESKGNIRFRGDGRNRKVDSFDIYIWPIGQWLVCHTNYCLSFHLADACNVLPHVSDCDNNIKTTSVSNSYVSSNRLFVCKFNAFQNEKGPFALYETIGLNSGKQGKDAGENSRNYGGSQHPTFAAAHLLFQAACLVCLTDLGSLWLFCFVYVDRWYWRLLGVAILGLFFCFIGFLFSHPFSPFRYLVAENAPVFCGSYGVSATRYSGTKYVNVLPVVLTERKLRDVQRHVLGADFVETADDAPLDDRPETLDCLIVNRADDILLLGMINSCLVGSHRVIAKSTMN